MSNNAVMRFDANEDGTVEMTAMFEGELEPDNEAHLMLAVVYNLLADNEPPYDRERAMRTLRELR